jgi:hypothetical protein
MKKNTDNKTGYGKEKAINFRFMSHDYLGMMIHAEAHIDSKSLDYRIMETFRAEVSRATPSAWAIATAVKESFTPPPTPMNAIMRFIRWIFDNVIIIGPRRRSRWS